MTFEELEKAGEAIAKEFDAKEWLVLCESQKRGDAELKTYRVQVVINDPHVLKEEMSVNFFGKTPEIALSDLRASLEACY